MKFESVKCDECKRIQDGANHWLKMAVRISSDVPVLVALGEVEAGMGLSRPTEPYSTPTHIEIHDLCGQGCAVKHLAALLKWNVPTEAQ